MSSIPAFFRRSGQAFQPLPLARSPWSDHALLGPAVCGLLAQELEQELRTEDFMPARFSVGLHRPVPAVPLTVRVRISRDSNRIRAAGADLIAGDEPVAHADVVFLRTSTAPPGAVWAGTRTPPVPPLESYPDDHKPIYGSDGFAGGWSTEIGDHMDASRKRTWMRPIELVAGEKPSPFVFAAILGEQASFVTNWGTAGVEHINIDLSMNFARLPASIPWGMGIEADGRYGGEGVAAGAATVYDQDGPIAIATVSALANALRQVDLESVGDRAPS